MLGVEAWTTIRYLQAQGVGIRAICRQLGVSRTAVRRALRSDGPAALPAASAAEPAAGAVRGADPRLVLRPAPDRLAHPARAAQARLHRRPDGAVRVPEAAAGGGAVGQSDGPLRDATRSAGAVRLVAVHAGAGRRADQGDRLRHDPGLQPAQALHRQPGRNPGVDLRGDRSVPAPLRRRAEGAAGR